jgi:hypothetical protein
MAQKTNEQGQKYIEVLSEEYIRLKECELNQLWGIYYESHNVIERKSPELLIKIEELESHIEDLKAEL